MKDYRSECRLVFILNALGIKVFFHAQESTCSRAFSSRTSISSGSFWLPRAHNTSSLCPLERGEKWALFSMTCLTLSVYHAPTYRDDTFLCLVGSRSREMAAVCEIGSTNRP